MSKNKVAFLKGRILSSQSENFDSLLKSSDWLEKTGSPKNNFCLGHINRLNDMQTNTTSIYFQP